jgi:hypothetical protein
VVAEQQGFSLNARKEASSEDWRYVFEGKKQIDRFINLTIFSQKNLVQIPDEILPNNTGKHS